MLSCAMSKSTTSNFSNNSSYLYFVHLDFQCFLDDSMLMFIIRVCLNPLWQKLTFDLFNRLLFCLQYNYLWKQRMQQVHHVASHFNCSCKCIQSHPFCSPKSKNLSWYHKLRCHFPCIHHLKSVFLISLRDKLKIILQSRGIKHRIQGATTVLRFFHFAVFYVE